MSSRPRLLLIDRDPEDRALARLVLSAALPGAVFDEVGDGSELLRALEHGFYDLVITEFDAEWAQGLFLLQAIRVRQPRAAVVVFTATDDRQSAVEALKAGAADFVVKSSAGFLDLRRAATEALPELSAATVGADAREIVAERARVVPGADPRRPDERSGAAGTVVPPTEVGRETEPSEAATVAVKREIDRDPEPAESPSPPEPENHAIPQLERVAPVAQPVVPMMDSESPAGDDLSEATAPRAAESFRSVVETARQSISAASHRPLGAVLGIIVVLAAFIILYATFFGGDSVSVEAGGAPTAAPSAAPAADSTTVDSELSSPAPTGRTVSEPVPVTRIQAELDSDETSPSTEAPLVLDLQASDTVWIQVTVDGETVIDAVLSAGQTRSFAGRHTATLLVGNAAGLTVRWNGEDLGVLGGEGRVRRLHFTPTEVGVGPPPA